MKYKEKLIDLIIDVDNFIWYNYPNDADYINQDATECAVLDKEKYLLDELMSILDKYAPRFDYDLTKEKINKWQTCN